METEPGKVPELRPEIVFLFDLVRQLVSGRIRIPRFQRPFVWRRDQMLDLLDSINRQYPIGSLLAWETDAEIQSLPTIGPITVSFTDTANAVYLLDGHQRLSTIAGALISPTDRSVADEEDPSRWSLYYNAKDNGFEHLGIGAYPEVYQFPMSKILDTFEFLAECQRVIAAGGDEGRLYVERIQDVARSFQNYKIPVIQIRQTGLTEAVEIFARLNSKGQAMTADQMVSALLYRKGGERPFDLAQEITDSLNALNAIGFGGIDRTLILRTLLAAIGEDIYRTDWTRIALTRRDELQRRLQEALPAVNRSLEEAAKFFVDHLGVRTDRLIPYAMQMTVFSCFFYAQPSPSESQIDLLKRWFWVSSFSGWFAGANPSRVNALVRTFMDDVAKNRESPSLPSFDLDMPALPIPRSFDMRSARTRVLLLMLFSLRPLDRNGEEIARPDELLRLYGPEALGYVAATVRDRELARSPANRILRDRPDDRGQAKNWLVQCDPASKAAIWASHGMPIQAVDLLNASDASDFLEARLVHLRTIEDSFMAARGVTQSASQLPGAAPVDSE